MSAAVTVGIPTHGFPHTRAPRSCVSLWSILLQRHYRGRQLVLSGQLRPFISLPGTAVIKQNKETGSNSRVKEKKITLPFGWLSFRGFSSACFSPCCFLWRTRGGRSVKVYCWGSYILQVMLSMREKDRGRERKRERERERVSRQTRFIYCQDNRVSASPVSSFKIAEIDFSWGTWLYCGKNMKENTQAVIAGCCWILNSAALRDFLYLSFWVAGSQEAFRLQAEGASLEILLLFAFIVFKSL